jgi:FdhE protein
VTTTAAERLTDLARTDASVAPLALLQAEALRAAADNAWAQAVPEYSREQVEHGEPLLHGQTLHVEEGAAAGLLERLARATAGSTGAGTATLARAVRDKRLEPLPLLEASVGQDGERLAALAVAADVDPGALAALGQLLGSPLLQACGAAARPVLDGVRWEAGYCPLCAAWPVLAELRGLDAERWLRCGRCGAGWPYLHGRCVYCGNSDHRTQGYLAPEAEREARRAVTCDACHGYLKTLTSFGLIPPEELPWQDLTTLELDVAAIERGYGRPDAPGFPLAVTIREISRQATARWLPWRR